MNRRAFLRYSLLGGAMVLIGSYPVWIERTTVLINHYTIPIPNLPLPFHGFTLAQLTDLHLGFLVSPAFIAGVVERTNRLGTDVIVCTGDYVHESNTRHGIDQAWPLLTRLRARDGVFSVLGNHDHWADTEHSLDWLRRSGQDLRHRCQAIEREGSRIWIGGAGDYWEDTLGVDTAFAASEAGACRILLAHNPDTVDTEFATPIALTVCGHTHGGQVVIPGYGAPVTPVQNKRYVSGLIPTPKTQVFISRGIGWAIYPIRFNCYPEIAVLRLVRASSPRLG